MNLFRIASRIANFSMVRKVVGEDIYDLLEGFGLDPKKITVNDLNKQITYTDGSKKVKGSVLDAIKSKFKASNTKELLDYAAARLNEFEDERSDLFKDNPKEFKNTQENILLNEYGMTYNMFTSMMEAGLGGSSYGRELGEDQFESQQQQEQLGEDDFITSLSVQEIGQIIEKFVKEHNFKLTKELVKELDAILAQYDTSTDKFFGDASEKVLEYMKTEYDVPDVKLHSVQEQVRQNPAVLVKYIKDNFGISKPTYNTGIVNSNKAKTLLVKNNPDAPEFRSRRSSSRFATLRDRYIYETFVQFSYPKHY